MEKSQEKLNQLRDVLREHKTMLIALQDNPDPDSIAAAVALRKLANSLWNIQCSIAHGGAVGRAENRALVRYLGLNLRPIDQLDMTQFELFAMVDTQPATGNNSLPGHIEPDIVIDHHTCRQQTRLCRFTDIRNRYGATATIMYEYLTCAGIQIEVPLATALLYAIRSDTQDLGRDTTKADMDVFLKLYPIANKRMLSEIQRGVVRRDYFQMLADGLKNAKVYDNAVVTNLGWIDNPDMIAEVADLLLRDETTNWVMVYAFTQNKLMISLRSTDETARADKVVAHIVGRTGTGGGHPSYAGGQIPWDQLTDKQKQILEDKVTAKFVKEVTKTTGQGQSLIQIDAD
jgi:nanoRNase/pAp phosphatase (c-di-AMP/oligoRNAs hydrolase)